MNVTIRYLALASATMLLMLTGLLAGSSTVDLRDILEGPSPPQHSVMNTILWDIRMPRVAVSLLAGGCLGLAGAIIQLFTRSPLGDPNLFGIGGGAAIFLALVAGGYISLGQTGVFAGSLSSSLLVGILFGQLISKNNITPIRVAIIGIALGALTIALGTSVISHGRVFPTQVIGLVTGSFTSSNWTTVGYMLPTLGTAILASTLISSRFYPIILGDVLSRSLGVNPARTRLAAMSIAGGLSGASVYSGGLMGFVGLMSPHIARRILGNNPTQLITGSIWVGAIITIFADQISRLILAPIELPVGMTTTLLGAPMMMYIALKMK